MKPYCSVRKLSTLEVINAAAVSYVRVFMKQANGKQCSYLLAQLGNNFLSVFLLFPLFLAFHVINSLSEKNPLSHVFFFLPLYHFSLGKRMYYDKKRAAVEARKIGCKCYGAFCVRVRDRNTDTFPTRPVVCVCVSGIRGRVRVHTGLDDKLV